MAANTTAGTNCTIILINYNGYADTVECVDSILLTNTNAQIIILDNNSHSQQGQALQQKYQHHKNITCLLSSQNLGFAGGNNYACKFVQTPYIVFFEQRYNCHTTLARASAPTVPKSLRFSLYST